METESISTWDARPVKHKNKLRYPQSSDPASPRNFFVCIAVGSRGQGKSYSVVKLIKQFERFKVYDEDGNVVDQRVILFSPTIDSNPIFNSLKHLDDGDIHTNYTDDKLLAVVDDIKKERDETKRYKEDLAIWKRFLRAKTETELTQEDHYALSRLGYKPPTKPKYEHGCVVHLVADDLIGTPAFRMVGKSAMTNLVLKNRHLGVNIYICAQSLKSIPKPIRLNTSVFILYRFANTKMILDDIYLEISGLMTPDEFLTAYEFATREKHSALVLDMSGGKPENRIRRNFDTRLIIPGVVARG